MKPKRFTIDPYKNALFLFCPCTREQAEAWVKRKKLGDMELSSYDEADAITVYTDAGNLVFMHKFEDTPAGLAILVHELCHVTFNVLNATGVKEADGTEEAAAYLLDNLTEKCVKHLRKQADGKPSESPSLPASAEGTPDSP